MAPETASLAWVKCADHVWRRPGDYPGLRLPVPPLAVQPVFRADRPVKENHDG
jgi:hypothetical protein